MYHVVVRIEVKADRIQDFIELATFNSRNSRLEPGNLRFDVIQQVDNPRRFALYEVYRDEAGFKAHQQTPHYARWRTEIEGLQAVPRTSDKFNSIAPTPYL